jgi:3-dehydroquinate dehydratase type I
MTFNICVPTQIKSVNLDEISASINNAVRLNPTIIEFRFDYIDDVQNLNAESVKDLLGLVPRKIPVIFTFRTFKEGGKMKMDEKDRIKIIKKLIEARPYYLDIEMNTEREIIIEIVNLALQNKVNVIFSYHDFEKTPAYEIAYNNIQNFVIKLTTEYGFSLDEMQGSLIKVIFKANSLQDNLIPLLLCKKTSVGTLKIISFCMGNKGIFSRILCVLSGSFLTYASSDEQTAPGQINIQLMRDLLNTLTKKN